jgi:hypothetical protein
MSLAGRCRREPELSCSCEAERLQSKDNVDTFRFLLLGAGFV